MDLEKKFDLLLAEMKNICNKIDDKFEKVDERFEQIDERFEQIDERFEQIDKRFEQNEKKLDDMAKNISNIKTNNQYEHGRIYNMVNCLNSTFLQFETEQKDNIDFLFAENEDHRNHQNIYGHEFHKLNDLVAKNSFRISNLEQHFN